MTSRKLVPASTVLSPRNKSPTMTATTTTTTTTTDYVEAVQTLNESTMKQACEWLMDDLDPEASEKLLDVYFKCESALKIIQKQQPALASLLTNSPVPLPGAPNLNLLNGSQSQSQQQQLQLQSQAQLRGSLPKLTSLTAAKKGGAVIAKGGVIPMRRTAMTKPGGRLRPEASSQSDSDLLSSVTQPLSKKARVAPPTMDNPRAPPPSALNFLAKLNKDGNSSSSGNNGKAPSPTNTDTNASSNSKRNPPRAVHRRSSA